MRALLARQGTRRVRRAWHLWRVNSAREASAKAHAYTIVLRGSNAARSILLLLTRSSSRQQRKAWLAWNTCTVESAQVAAQAATDDRLEVAHEKIARMSKVRILWNFALIKNNHFTSFFNLLPSPNAGERKIGRLRGRNWPDSDAFSLADDHHDDPVGPYSHAEARYLRVFFSSSRLLGHARFC